MQAERSGPRAQLGDANRWLELAQSTAYAGGPALGGAIAGSTGAPAACVLATALSILAVILLRGLPDSRGSGLEGVRIMTATFGARPIRATLGAVVAARSGVEACLLVATGGFLMQLLAISGSQVPKFKESTLNKGQISDLAAVGRSGEHPISP